MPFPATGATIALRRLEPADLRTFQTYRSDVEVGRYQGWSPMTDAAAIAFIASSRGHGPTAGPRSATSSAVPGRGRRRATSTRR